MNNLAALERPRFIDMKFNAGLDLITPSKYTQAGSCREAQNFEIDINGGYSSITGYERFDGQAKPSNAIYYTMSITLSGSVVDGDTVTGATSSATGVVIAVALDAAGNQYIAMTKVVGTFASGENLEVSAVVEAVTSSVASPNGGETGLLNAQYNNLAADQYRADITEVTGSDAILGVWMLNNVVYAWRNNAGGTAAAMYKQTTSGWSLVALGQKLAFTSGGVTEIVEGQVITGLVSGATATLTRVVLTSGSFAAGTAAGWFIAASHTGTFQAEGVEVAGSGDLATIAGDFAAITMLPDGRFEFVNHNFGGGAGEERMYGCDKINQGFEFDGTVFVPITTGMTVDTPTHVTAHENHLFFSFAGSAQHSGIGTPYVWTVISGAAELAIGDTITAFTVQVGSEGNSTLAIFARNRTTMLYGTSSADWNLVQYRKEVGAYAYSVQEFGMTLMLDDRGIANLLATQDFGNFQANVVSRLIQPFVNQRKTNVTASSISREKSQYRLFFADKYALYVTTDNRKVTGIMPQLFNDKVECMFSLEDSSGNEIIMFGSEDGFVYQLDKGTSFDGDDIETFLVLHFNSQGMESWIKSYLGAVMEVAGNGYSEYNFTYELGYNSVLIPQPNSVTEILNFSDVRWDSFVWDAFIWDGTVLEPSRITLQGSAENISLIFRNNSDYYSPISFHGAQLRLLPRRQLR